jgi:hypothetical protein
MLSILAVGDVVQVMVAALMTDDGYISRVIAKVTLVSIERYTGSYILMWGESRSKQVEKWYDGDYIVDETVVVDIVVVRKGRAPWCLDQIFEFEPREMDDGG